MLLDPPELEKASVDELAPTPGVLLLGRVLLGLPASIAPGETDVGLLLSAELGDVDVVGGLPLLLVASLCRALFHGSPRRALLSTMIIVSPSMVQDDSFVTTKS